MPNRIAHATITLLLATATLAAAQGPVSADAGSADAALASTVFLKTRQVIPQGNNEKEFPVRLTVGPSRLVVSSKKGSRMAVDIPYEAIRDVSYEYGERRRIKEGGLLMAASIGAGALVMFTKSKSHWLVVEHDTPEGSAVTVLHLHKNNFGQIIHALEERIGRQVRLAGEGR